MSDVRNGGKKSEVIRYLLSGKGLSRENSDVFPKAYVSFSPASFKI
jgi:hypothetical protein